MLKLCKVTKVKVFFPVMVYIFNFELFQLSAAILEKGLFTHVNRSPYNVMQYKQCNYYLINLWFPSMCHKDGGPWT